MDIELSNVIDIRPDPKLKTKTWLVFATITVFGFLVALVVQALVSLDEEIAFAGVGATLWPIMVAAGVLFWLIGVPIAILWINNLRYVIEDDKVTLYKGILTKIQKNIPHRAVTDFILHRSLYDRWLGIASVRIQTAGQSQNATGYEGNLAGLRDWNGLHRVLREKVKRLHPISGSLGVTEPAAAPALHPAAPSGAGADVQAQMLEELRAIRRALEK